MDESWRMRMGTHAPKLPNHPPRRSTGDTSTHNRTTLSGNGHLNPEDFADVFGGPPRTVLSRRFGGGIPRSASPSSSSGDFSCEDAFRRTEAVGSGRKFPQFKIPFGKQRSFYGDIFGWEHSNINNNNKIDDESVVRSRSRSKASSSSALSSEDLSPLRPAISDGGYDDVYLFGSKLRPINVFRKCRSRPFREANYNNRNISEIDFFEYMKNRPLEPSRKKNASPELTNTEPIPSNGSFEKSDDELKFNSPSSPAVSSSSICHSESGEMKTRDYEINDDNDDESMSSFAIEFDIGKCEWTCEETNGVDEAIAWVKEKSRMNPISYQEKSTKVGQHPFSLSFCHGIRAGSILDRVMTYPLFSHEFLSWYQSRFYLGPCDDVPIVYPGSILDRVMTYPLFIPHVPVYGSLFVVGLGAPSPVGLGLSKESQVRGRVRISLDIEIKDECAAEEETNKIIIDEKIKLWSTGRQADIRQLLSSMHHILWPNSGWVTIPLTNIIESSQVKKAYHKAQLCLHPDKLQQKGATLMQKYIAQKVFSALQDAWAAFISRDGLCSAS
ncbi:chaperone DnaJ-domain superfamily protein [Striga asiatica]|uniref:Chaperone DnaJ-domain superfamily protein n=1 Tax=Striga asiatica TaxID=4170 RepID=A0A5A7NZS7_STRAF|nr:chaperone DnaJ-domain superfamily protein [Striga asiatica]